VSGSIRGAAVATGRTTSAVLKNSSIGTSTKTGPRCEAPATANASSSPAATSAAVCNVLESLATGAMIGGWSSSWSEPVPQRLAGARPPTTTIGEPANWAWATALTPLVTPGPAVRTARPGLRVSLPVASAANAAVCSCRTSMIRIGGSAVTAPSYIGKTWAPERVYMASTPCARATATACWPAWASTESWLWEVIPRGYSSGSSRGSPDFGGSGTQCALGRGKYAGLVRRR
jgi:hypothetical protein